VVARYVRHGYAPARQKTKEFWIPSIGIDVCVV